MASDASVERIEPLGVVARYAPSFKICRHSCQWREHGPSHRAKAIEEKLGLNAQGRRTREGFFLSKAVWQLLAEPDVQSGYRQ